MALRIVSATARRRDQKRFFSKSLSSRHQVLLQKIESHGIVDNGHIKLNFINNDTVADIKISNPARRNAISGVMMNELAQIVDKVLSKESLVGLMIRGDGSFFCSGADLTLARDYINTPSGGKMMSAFMTEALNMLRDSHLVSVCLLSGSALGGGAELSTTADYRIFCQYPDAVPTSVSFVHAKLGVTPGWGGAARLHSMVGRGNALRLLGTSKQMLAEEAISIGFAESKVVTANEDDVINAGLQFLDPFVQQKFPAAVRAAKQIIAQIDKNQELGRSLESETFANRWGGKDNSSAINSNPIASKR